MATSADMHFMPAEAGWIEVICGPMFSGKSEELIRRLRRAQIARLPVRVFRPAIDDRYHKTRVVSHSANSIEATTVTTSADIASRLDRELRVVGIDEAQFFDEGVVSLAERLAAQGVRVIAAGLDLDYMGKPFSPMPELLAVAEYVTKTLAICIQCGAPAGRSQRLAGGADKVQVGAAQSYEARCRRCHVPRAEPTTGQLFDTDR